MMQYQRLDKLIPATMEQPDIVNPSFFLEGDHSFATGIFLERPNRFLASVLYGGKTIDCHVPDPGRLKDILMPGCQVLLRFSNQKTERKTLASVVGANIEDFWVSTDSQLANRFVRHTWKELPILGEFVFCRPEFPVGKSRFDFYLKNENQECIVEIKTVAVIHPTGSGIAKFPDAPTKRGAKHVEELAALHGEGYRTIVGFVVPRMDAKEVRPYREVDPNFAQVAEYAHESGVEFVGFRCRFSPQGITFDQLIPAKFG